MNKLIISIFFTLTMIGLSTMSVTPILYQLMYAQVYEYVNEDQNFSITIPTIWEIIPKPSNGTTSTTTSTSTTNTSSSFSLTPIEEKTNEFPYYDQNTSIALKLKGISELDFDKHTYITITVRDLESYLSFNETETSKVNLSQVVDNRINRLETGLDDRIYYDILSHNSTGLLGGEPAYQIKYITTLVPFDYFNVDTIAIHNEKLYDIYFNTGELFSTQTLPYMDRIIDSFRFLN